MRKEIGWRKKMLLKIVKLSVVNQAKLVVKHAFTFKLTMTLNHTWDISKNLVDIKKLVKIGSKRSLLHHNFKH